MRPALGNPHGGVARAAQQFARLAERPFGRDGGNAVQEIERFVKLAELAEHRNRLAGPGAEAPIGPWSGRSEWEAAQSLSDLARIQ